MTPDEILAEAAKIVTDDRQLDYGYPEVNHQRTAELWNAYLRGRNGRWNLPLSSEDVCWLNILQKISRDMHAAKDDNIVDTIGYALNIAMIRESR